MNLIDVNTQLQTEEQCLDFIEKVRWPDGKIRCVRCGSDKVSRITRTVNPRIARSEKKQNKRPRLYACLESTCNHRFTPTVGTLFHDSHLPLSKWFAAVALIVHAKKGMSALQLQRHLGVNYRTAWYLCHRIREAMNEPDGLKLTGTAEIYETYIGGKQRGHRGKLKNKDVLPGIRQRGGPLKLVQIVDNKAGTLYDAVSKHVDPNADRIMTD